VVPVEAVAVSVDSVPVWMGSLAPAGRITHRFRWLFREERSSVGGRGSARIAAPDSLRFDVAGPLGANPAAAMVVRDSAVWIHAPGSIKEIVPSYPLLWAGFGVGALPNGGEVIWAGQAGDIVAWRVAAGADTLTFALTRGTPRRLQAELRRSGQVMARMDTRYSAEGTLATARLSIPTRPAQLDLTFTLSDATARFPADVWRPRGP
jgi:hypothetical protein